MKLISITRVTGEGKNKVNNNIRINPAAIVSIHNNGDNEIMIHCDSGTQITLTGEECKSFEKQLDDL